MASGFSIRPILTLKDELAHFFTREAAGDRRRFTAVQGLLQADAVDWRLLYGGASDFDGHETLKCTSHLDRPL